MQPSSSSSSKAPQWLRLLPNALTILRFVLIAPFVVFALKGQYYAAAGVYLFALLTDIDGSIARKFNVTSRFGAILDPTVDAIFMFIGLSLAVYQGAVWVVPAGIYIASAALRGLPSLIHLRNTRTVQSTLLTKTVAFCGFFSVLFGTLRAPVWSTSILLFVGAIANVSITYHWMRSGVFSLRKH